MTQPASTAEPRMLERRVSNQRQDLSSDQQMNYLLSWFVNWSDLQKVSLFKGWVNTWSDDLKSYLLLRLKDIDQAFSRKYEHFLEFGKDSPERDFFEPGVPPELDLSLDRSSTGSMDRVEVSLTADDSFEGEGVNLKDYPTDDDLCKSQALSPIAEATSLNEVEEEEEED